LSLGIQKFTLFVGHKRQDTGNVIFLTILQTSLHELMLSVVGKWVVPQWS